MARPAGRTLRSLAAAIGARAAAEDVYRGARRGAPPRSSALRRAALLLLRGYGRYRGGDPAAPSSKPSRGAARLGQMQRGGPFSTSTTAPSAPGPTSSTRTIGRRAAPPRQYVIAGSAVVGARSRARPYRGNGRGDVPVLGQFLTAPISAYLNRQLSINARIDEYFLDNRVGRPDPRTFSDPRFYSEVLLEVIALEE